MEEKNNKAISFGQIVFIWASIWFLVSFFIFYGIDDNDQSMSILNAILLSVVLSIPLGILFAIFSKWTKELKQLTIKKHNKFMEEKNKKILDWINKNKVVLIILLGLGLFCWFQIRPAMIYSFCSKKLKGSTNYEYHYTKCLRENGVNK